MQRFDNEREEMKSCHEILKRCEKKIPLKIFLLSHGKLVIMLSKKG